MKFEIGIDDVNFLFISVFDFFDCFIVKVDLVLIVGDEW